MSDFLKITTPFDGCRRIVLARPDALNSFTYDMYREFTGELAKLRYDPTVHAVILTGEGRAFCAGHDVRNTDKASWMPEGLGKAYQARMLLSEINRLPTAIRTLPQPVIAAINGTAAGLGFALAVACDLALAGRTAKFVNVIHNAATGHEIGLSYMLPRAIGTQRAAELLLTSRPVHAEEAERIGLVLRAVEDDALQREAEELARSICQNVPIGIHLTKRSLWLNQDVGSLEAAIEMESRAVFMAQSTEDAAEKRASVAEGRPPRFTGR
jgi:enoyl-CoA hydratase